MFDHAVSCLNIPHQTSVFYYIRIHDDILYYIGYFCYCSALHSIMSYFVVLRFVLILCYVVLLCRITLSCIVLCRNVRIMLCYMALFCTILYFVKSIVILYYIILHYVILYYYIILYRIVYYVMS